MELPKVRRCWRSWRLEVSQVVWVERQWIPGEGTCRSEVYSTARGQLTLEFSNPGLTDIESGLAL